MDLLEIRAANASAQKELVGLVLPAEWHDGAFPRKRDILRVGLSCVQMDGERHGLRLSEDFDVLVTWVGVLLTNAG